VGVEADLEVCGTSAGIAIACRRGSVTYRRLSGFSLRSEPNLLPGLRPGNKARKQAWALQQTWKSAVRQQALRPAAGAAA
jgi:hypothetical protein